MELKRSSETFFDASREVVETKYNLVYVSVSSPNRKIKIAKKKQIV
jgi:hypothetical protein